MTEHLTEAAFLSHEEQMLGLVESGAVFIYPTDTVYGLGCDATNEHAVKRLRSIKHKDIKPVSVIAPSIAWIRTHCNIPKYAEEWLSRLPGPYTLILRLEGAHNLAPSVTMGAPGLGVRIPSHPVSQFVARLGRPFVTTSANVSHEPVITRIDALPESFSEVDVIIDGGELGGKASTIVDCTGDEAVVLRQ